MVSRRSIQVQEDVALSVIERPGPPDAPMFLLVHGLASNARLWDGVGDALEAAGVGSVAVDLRGHGESSKPESGYDFERIAGDLVAVIDQTIGRPVVAVGQSWGGNVVIELARRYPPKVEGLVCVDGGFIRLQDPFPAWEEAEVVLAPPDFSTLRAGDLEERSRRRYAGWPQSGVEGQLANFERFDDGSASPRLSRDRHMKILRSLWEHEPDSAAADIRVPILVVAVGRDQPGREKRVDAFARVAGGARVVWFEAEHDVHAQRPVEVADLLVEFADGAR